MWHSWNSFCPLKNFRIYSGKQEEFPHGKGGQVLAGRWHSELWAGHSWNPNLSAPVI